MCEKLHSWRPVYIRDVGLRHGVVEVFDFLDIARPVVVMYPVMFNCMASE